MGSSFDEVELDILERQDKPEIERIQGHTLIPVLENSQKKFSIGKSIVFADVSLLSNANIKALITHDYKLELGGKIKNENKEIKDATLGLEIIGEATIEVGKDGYRLVVSFSEKRMKKDHHN